jgi:hypothetical protein
VLASLHSGRAVPSSKRCRATRQSEPATVGVLLDRFTQECANYCQGAGYRNSF